jgi:hypothetical protein
MTPAAIAAKSLPDAQPINQHLLPDARRLDARHRTNTLRRLDGRSKEARRLKTITADLVAHLGGPERVSVASGILIERVAVDLVRLERLDAEAANGTFSEHDGRVAHALRNSVRLALKDLGLAPVSATAAAPPMDQLQSHLRRRERAS